MGEWLRCTASWVRGADSRQHAYSHEETLRANSSDKFYLNAVERRALKSEEIPSRLCRGFFFWFRSQVIQARFKLSRQQICSETQTSMHVELEPGSSFAV
jgi:hypothetical protein